LSFAVIKLDALRQVIQANPGGFRQIFDA